MGQLEDDFTWTHLHGATYRNDFVAVPLRWRPYQQRTLVSSVLELGLRSDDHRAPVPQVCFLSAEGPDDVDPDGA